MMPPEQETNGGAANNPLVRNGTNNISVHVEPPGSASNVSPCPDDQLQQQDVLHGFLQPITLKFEDVTYPIELRKNKGKRNILDGVSGVVRPGELQAMLGPSGSGKTTLLTALAARLPGQISGSITYNGQPFSSSTKRKIGFVTQDDVLYTHLTVVETLTYAAFLRLPNKLTKQEKIEHVELVIMELGLTTCRNSMIGGLLFRGISGGERKRVSIGQEMLVNPSLLLLDEPTSGLDSTTAQRIVATLRRLGRGGRTVVTTVHQPSSSMYMMFDKVIVLSEGSPIYSGSGNKVMDYFASFGYKPRFNFMNPADFLLDLANGVTPESSHDDQTEICGNHDHDHNLTKQFLISSYKKNLFPILKEEIQGASRHENFQEISLRSRSYENQWTNSWWVQFKVLLSRGLKERRHESFSGLIIFQVLSVSIISGLLWWHADASHIQDQVGLLFFFSIFWGFFPLYRAVFTFPQERPMLTRELYSGMYRLSSYYVARITGDLPMELILPTIFTTITYWMSGLKRSFTTFFLTLIILLLNVLVSQGLGLALGAILMDVKQAATLSSVVILVFLLSSGYYIQHMPSFISWLKYLSFSHHCYKFLVAVQYSKNEVYDCGLGGKNCRVEDFPAIKHLGIDNNMAVDMATFIIMLVGFRVLAYVALRLRQPH